MYMYNVNILNKLHDPATLSASVFFYWNIILWRLSEERNAELEKQLELVEDDLARLHIKLEEKNDRYHQIKYVQGRKIFKVDIFFYFFTLSILSK